jgi:hypothetical protein
MVDQYLPIRVVPERSKLIAAMICKVANYLRIWAAPRKLSANGSTLFANGESRSLMICGWDGNLFTRSKTVAGSAADEVSWAWL